MLPNRELCDQVANQHTREIERVKAELRRCTEVDRARFSRIEEVECCRYARSITRHECSLQQKLSREA